MGVTGELNESSSPLSLLASAFPGGSITGAPKIRAMEVIDELEPHRRNIYCGSVFYMGFREDMDSSICIRTVLAENRRLHCWAVVVVIVCWLMYVYVLPGAAAYVHIHDDVYI